MSEEGRDGAFLDVRATAALVDGSAAWMRRRGIIYDTVLMDAAWWHH